MTSGGQWATPQPIAVVTPGMHNRYILVYSEFGDEDIRPGCLVPRDEPDALRAPGLLERESCTIIIIAVMSNWSVLVAEVNTRRSGAEM